VLRRAEKVADSGAASVEATVVFMGSAGVWEHAV
jgi:hypothetical protein